MAKEGLLVALKKSERSSAERYKNNSNNARIKRLEKNLVN